LAYAHAHTRITCKVCLTTYLTQTVKICTYCKQKCHTCNQMKSSLAQGLDYMTTTKTHYTVTFGKQQNCFH